MTRMLVRVVDAAEAAQAAAAGVDVVELRLAAEAPLHLAGAQAVRSAFHGTLRLRCSCDMTPDLAAFASAVAADEIALPCAMSLPEKSTADSIAWVAVVETAIDWRAAIARVKGQAEAIMLEAGARERLVDVRGVTELDAFAFACRAAALPFGLAGRLEAPDVARLLLLEPDVLGFDRAVRRDHRTEGALDRAALDAIRALIPRHDAPRAASRPALIANDRIFVRDLVVPLSIGAYRAEHGAKQRVRFSVEAEIRREPVPPHDMRDVFSYDIIIETIRVLAQRPHVTFVETLAEEIAASLIAHPALVVVTVRVEKLDVIEGSVGVEITRRRPPA